jgi:iron complex outermembrane receptor protein
LLRYAALPLLLLLLATNRVAFAHDDKPEPEPEPEVLPPPPENPTHPENLTVRVEGQKRPGSASEIVIERDLARAAPHRTGSDMLSVVPGVFVTQHSGQGKAHQIFLRGFDADHGQDVEVWAGGAPINEVSNVHGQGYADMHFLMPEIVRQVRVLPGTYDVHQGDFAVAGSMFVDLGYAEPGFSASTTIGSFLERRLFLAYHPPSFDEETFVAFEAQATNGFGPNRAARRVSSTGQLGLDLGDSAHLRLQASFYAARFDSAGVLPITALRDPEFDPFTTLDPNQGGDSMRVQVVAEIRQAADDAARDRFSIAPYFVARDLRLRQNFTGYLVDPVAGDGTQQTNDAKTVGLRGKYSRRFDWLSPRDEVELGVVARSDWIDQTQQRLSGVNDRVTADLVDSEIRATNLAGYASAELTAWNRLRMKAGLRADGLFYNARDAVAEFAGAERSSMGFHLGPKVTVDVLTVTGLNVLASFGTGFRSPQARSLADAEPTPFTEVLSFEAGARYTTGQDFVASLAAFHTRLSNDVFFDPVLARNEPAPATARTGGVATVTSRPTPWFVSQGSITYTHASFLEASAKNEEGDLLPYAPQIVARADLGATPELTTVLDRALVLKAGVGLSLIARRPLPLSELGANIFQADASLGLRWKEIELKADVFNLFDARWFDGEFTYASNFERGDAPSLVPQRHATIGYPFTAFFTASAYL